VIAPEKPPPPRPTVISNPDWIRQPDGDELAQYYPERASRMGVSGRAVLHCTVSAQGTLSCSIASEDPQDQGFGEAAMKMQHFFKMRPQTRDGVPVAGGQINVPIRFQAPKD
jgi:protein TonB